MIDTSIKFSNEVCPRCLEKMQSPKTGITPEELAEFDITFDTPLKLKEMEDEKESILWKEISTRESIAWILLSIALVVIIYIK